MVKLDESFKQCVVKSLNNKGFLNTLNDNGLVIVLDVIGSSFEIYVEQYQKEIYTRNFGSFKSYEIVKDIGISPYSDWADILVRSCVEWENVLISLGNTLPKDYTVIASSEGVSLKGIRFS